MGQEVWHEEAVEVCQEFKQEPFQLVIDCSFGIGSSRQVSVTKQIINRSTTSEIRN